MMRIDIDPSAKDPTVVCWACQDDITYYAVRESLFGEQFCAGCATQLKKFAHAIRLNALNDRQNLSIPLLRINMISDL